MPEAGHAHAALPVLAEELCPQHCPCSLTLTWQLPQGCSQEPHKLGINVESQIVTRLQAELLLHSIIPEFPGPNTSQRKGSSICALANAQMQAQMAAPTLPYLLPVLFTVPKPSSESDAEHVFTGCVQGLELLFQHRDGMEGQSLVLIVNWNSWGFSAPASAHLPLTVKQSHGMAACQRILTPVQHIVLDWPGWSWCRLVWDQPRTVAGHGKMSWQCWSIAPARCCTWGWPGHPGSRSNG